MNVTRSDIASARGAVEFANREVNRWGMVLAALTEKRESLRRGVDDGTTDEAVARFGRILTGLPETSTSERRSELAYLDSRTIPEGPGSGKTLLQYADGLSWTAPFPSRLRSYVTGGDGGPAPAEVVATFDREALVPAVSNHAGDPAKLDALVDLAEAGLRAARSVREDAIGRLNNEFDEDGNRVATGLVQAFHEGDGGDRNVGPKATGDDLVDSFAETTGNDPDHLREYRKLVAGLDELPAVLLPVGLETRFVDASDDRTGETPELWVRVYPDDVHVDAHEAALTPQEERWGKTFWTQVYVARFPVDPSDSFDPKDRFYLPPEDKLPEDPVATEQLRLLFYDTAEGTTLEDFSTDVGARYREVKERAWGMLVERAGRERAAHVVRRTAPVDHSDSGEPETSVTVLGGPVDTDATDAGAIRSRLTEVDPLEFPAVEYRPGPWTKQPRARFLPDRWLAFVEWTDEAGTERSATVAAPHAVREPLYMGPNPESVAAAKRDTSNAGDTPDGSDAPNSTKEAVDAGMEWMVDFEEAEHAGMAFRVTAADLGTSDLPDSFDRVSVFGLKASMDATESVDALEELLDVHHYTRGLELLPNGTPTNNHGGESGYRTNEDHVDTVGTDVGDPLTEAGEFTDANLLTEVLGIGQPEGSDHPLARVEGADSTDWFDAYHMHSVLWPGTVGHYLRHVLTPGKYLDHTWTDAELSSDTELLAAVREHFVRYVRGGGPLPALRVGNQPYGVLPATSLDAHETPSDSPPEDAAYWFVLRAVTWFRTFWERSLDNVHRVDPEAAADGVGGGSLYDGIDWTPVLSGVGSGLAGGTDDRTGTDGGEDVGTEGDSRSTIERILAQEAVSNTYKHRPYMLEYQSKGYRHFGAYQELKDVGLDFDPRIGRFSHFDVMANRTRFPYFDMVAGRSELDPIAGVVSPSEHYLDELSRASTGDLVRLGYDYDTRRFEHLFAELFTGHGSIDSWSALSGLFDDVEGALRTWVETGDKPSQVTQLEGLFETDRTPYEDVTFVPDFDPAAATEFLVEDQLGAAHDDAEKNRVTLVLLFVAALDEYLGGRPESNSRGREIELASGEVVYVDTARQDGHERFVADLEEIRYAIRRDFRNAAGDDDVDWPDGAGRIRDLHSKLLFSLLFGGVGDPDAPFMDFNMDEDVSDELREKMSSVTDAFGEDGQAEGWDVLAQLVNWHTVDYLTLALTFKSTPTEDRKEVWQSFREPGASAIPTGDVVSVGTKADRDTSLFGLVTWYATVNANLNVIQRHADGGLTPDDFVIGANDEGDRGRTTYELLDEHSATDLQEALGWSGGYDQHHEIATEFAGGNWFGLLDAMRSEKYVGLDATDDRFTSFQGSLRWMAREGWLSPERADHTERLFSSTLDLASHRLDAWWTSLATRRLSEIRSGSGEDLMAVDVAGAWTDTATESEKSGYHPDVSNHEFELDTDAPTLARPDGDGGTYVGAYGFVENLERDDDEANTEYEYLQAHSVSHARTAAILRSGYRSNPDEKLKEKLQVDLSPRRVRKAQTVLEGLRQGLWLGEMLGYYFERRLHEVSEETTNVDLERYIDDFREYRPLSEGKIDRGGGGDRPDPAATANVVDGYALYEAVTEKGPGRVYRAVGADDHHDELTAVFEEMEAIVDAVADLLTAENVHQLQQGNYSQAGRSVAALAEGKVPRNPEIAETRRDHVGVTHRVLALTGLGDGGTGNELSPPKPWRIGKRVEMPTVDDDGALELDPDGNPVTTAEEFVVRDEGAPVVNDLAGRLFPDPGAVRCRAAYRWTEEAADGTETDREVSTAVTLADLRLSPVDALYLTQRTGDAGASKLESHVAYYLVRNRPTDGEGDPEVPNDATVAVTFDEVPASAPDGTLSFGDFVELSRSVRDLVSDGRPADATDFAHPGDDVSPDRVPGPLRSNADDAEATLADVESVLTNRLAAFGSHTAGEEFEFAGVPDSSDGGGSDGGSGSGSGSGSDGNGDSGSGSGSGSDSGGNGGSGSGSGSGSGGNGGSDPGDSPEDGDGSVFGDRTADVQRIQDELEAFAAEAHLSSARREADHLSGSDFLTELDAVERRLPAGPTDPTTVDRDLTVEPEGQSVEGTVRAAPPTVDVYLPPEEHRVTGRSNGVPDVFVEDPAGEVIAEPSPTHSGGEFEATYDFAEVLSRPDSLRVVVVRVEGTDAAVTRFGEGETASDGTDGARVRVAVGPRNLLTALQEGTLTVSVAVESQSPAVRFSRSVSNVTVGNDGDYAADVDFGSATPGTPFEVTAVAELPSSSVVLDTRSGRVVGDAPDGGVDDAFVRSLTVLPRLLWLDAHAPAYAPVSVPEGRLPTESDALPGPGRFHPAKRSGPRSGQVTGTGVDPGRLREEFDADAVSIGAALGGAESVGPGPVRELVGGDGSEDPQAGDDGSGTDAGDDTTVAHRLERAVRAADWTAIDREFALMPETRTTFGAAEREAVGALLSLQDVDFPGLSRALTGGDDPRGVVTTARKLGLTGAIDTVGTDADFLLEAPGTGRREGQQFFASTNGSALAEAKARIRAFRRDYWPSDVRWRTDELFLVDGELVEFVADRGLEAEFAVLVSVVSDPAWNAGTLSALTDEPHRLIRGVDDLLYHPESLDEEGYAAVANHLAAVAAGDSFTVDETSADEHVERFAAVADADADFLTPLATVAADLKAFEPGTASEDDATSRTQFVEAFDGAVRTLRTNLGLLDTAAAGHDLADAFREGLLETLRRPLVRAAYFGVYGAMPAEAAGGSETVARNLVRQAEDVLGSVRDRLSKASSVDAADPVDHEVDRLRALFGEEFQVVPPFEPVNPREIGRTFGDGRLLNHGSAGPLPVETWLQRSSRVREQVGMFRETLTYADTVNDGDLLGLDVGQLPYYPDDDWVGIDGVRPNVSDRVSVVAHTDDGFDAMVADGMGETPRMAGLFVDEWVEQFPAEEEHTAVSFRYDDPGNRPPQSILVATPPRSGDGAPWSVETLRKTVGETLTVSKYRAVDLEALRPDSRTERVAIGHLLPGLLFANDTHVQPNHPEVDFTPLEQYGEYAERAILWNLTNVAGGSFGTGGLGDVGNVGNVDFTLGGED